MVALPILANSGASIYKQKCQNCHGKNGELQALGRSDAIMGWDKAKTAEALMGYQNGTRNIKGFGGLMKKEAAPYTADEIRDIAAYIATLKK